MLEDQKCKSTVTTNQVPYKILKYYILKENIFYITKKLSELLEYKFDSYFMDLPP